MRALTSNQHDLSQNLNMILLKSMDVNRRWRLVISLALVLVLLLTKMSYDLRKWNVSFPSPIFKFLYSTPINLNSAIHYSKIIFSLKAESLADVNIETLNHRNMELQRQLTVNCVFAVLVVTSRVLTSNYQNYPSCKPEWKKEFWEWKFTKKQDVCDQWPIISNVDTNKLHCDPVLILEVLFTMNGSTLSA